MGGLSLLLYSGAHKNKNQTNFLTRFRQEILILMATDHDKLFKISVNFQILSSNPPTGPQEQQDHRYHGERFFLEIYLFSWRWGLVHLELHVYHLLQTHLFSLLAPNSPSFSGETPLSWKQRMKHLLRKGHLRPFSRRDLKLDLLQSSQLRKVPRERTTT